MLKHLDFFSTRLNKPLHAGVGLAKLRPLYGVLDLLNGLSDGDHIYLVLSYQGRSEVVKYTHTKSLDLIGGEIQIRIERGQHGTTVTSWPAGACIRAEMTSDIVAELAKQNCCENMEVS